MTEVEANNLPAKKTEFDDGENLETSFEASAEAKWDEPVFPADEFGDTEDIEDGDEDGRPKEKSKKGLLFFGFLGALILAGAGYGYLHFVEKPVDVAAVAPPEAASAEPKLAEMLTSPSAQPAEEMKVEDGGAVVSSAQPTEAVTAPEMVKPVSEPAPAAQELPKFSGAQMVPDSKSAESPAAPALPAVTPPASVAVPDTAVVGTAAPAEPVAAAPVMAPKEQLSVPSADHTGQMQTPATATETNPAPAVAASLAPKVALPTEMPPTTEPSSVKTPPASAPVAAVAAPTESVVTPPVETHKPSKPAAHTTAAGKAKPAPAAAKPRNTKAPVSQAQGVKQKKSPVLSVEYILKSAMTGEAWVSSKEKPDELRSLRVGDVVSGLGKIKSIERENGAWVVVGTAGMLK